METVSREAAQGGSEVESPDDAAETGPIDTAASEEEMIRRFLASAGVPPSKLGGDIVALRNFVADLVRSAGDDMRSDSERTLDVPIVESTE